MDGAFLRTGPNSSGPGYGKTSYLEYSLPQSFVDNLNAGGGYTIEVLTHFIGNSAGPGSLFALGGKNISTNLHLKADGSVLTHRNVGISSFGALSAAKTNTVATVFDGTKTFSQYRNAILVKSVDNATAGAATKQAATRLVGTFSAGSDWGSSVDAYAIRIYERALTPREIAMNARTDDERYFGSNVTYVVDVKSAYANPTRLRVLASTVWRRAPGSRLIRTAVRSAKATVRRCRGGRGVPTEARRSPAPGRRRTFR